ncbi:hypothetical protein PO909_017203, partial [Leuciscus waleckii]
SRALQTAVVPTTIRSSRNGKCQDQSDRDLQRSGSLPELAGEMSEAVDVGHRLGRPVSGRARVIIILFALRWVRDFWKSAKNSEYLKERKIRFGEDLTKEEKGSRALKARNEGEKAYFIGSKAYVAGKQIVPEKMDTS